MTSRLERTMAKVADASMKQRALSAGLGAALGAFIGPTAATFTGDQKSDKNTLTRDMIAGALGGAIGGLVSGPGLAAAGGALGGGFMGLFDKEKKSSSSGQDLRLPVMGGTKFPTQDSLGSATKKLQQSSAEVGPLGKAAGVGDPMDPMMSDPLVQFLKQASIDDEANEHPPLTGLVDGSELENNHDSYPHGQEEPELASMSPKPTKRMEARRMAARGAAADLFDNAHATRKKLYDKDHSWEGFDQGVVDRVLGL